MSDVTKQGQELIKEWISDVNTLKTSEQKIDNLRNHVSDSRNALGEWLCPGDAKVGESFCVWHGDSLIQATKREGGYMVVVRSRGKSLNQL